MLNDMGILADSVRYYHDADAFTATNLYHVPHAGSYHCDETYGMQRNYLDICQMLVVDEGELSVTYRGETRTAGPGSLILLDCREPHSYHALTDPHALVPLCRQQQHGLYTSYSQYARVHPAHRKQCRD